MRKGRIYGLLPSTFKLKTAFGGQFVQTTLELSDSKEAVVEIAVAVKVHHPTVRFETVSVVLVQLVDAVTVAFELPAVKTVLLPGAAYTLMIPT